MQFCINTDEYLSHITFLKRFEEAKGLGFNYVELESFHDYSVSDIKEHLFDTKVHLAHSFCEEGTSRHAFLPGREHELPSSLAKLVQYQSLGIRKVVIPAGERNYNFSLDDQFNAFVKSLDAVSFVMRYYGWTGLIEPIPSAKMPNYLLSSFDLALSIMQATKNPNIKLLLDVNHLQDMVGDVRVNLPKYYPYAGHIKLAELLDVDGLVNLDEVDLEEVLQVQKKWDHEYVLQFLQEQGHSDVISVGV